MQEPQNRKPQTSKDLMFHVPTVRSLKVCEKIDNLQNGLTHRLLHQTKRFAKESRNVLRTWGYRCVSTQLGFWEASKSSVQNVPSSLIIYPFTIPVWYVLDHKPFKGHVFNLRPFEPLGTYMSHVVYDWQPEYVHSNHRKKHNYTHETLL